MPVPVIQSDRTLANLILYVVAQLNEMGRKPSTIQLWKILYLVELEHQRVLHRRLTDLGWIHYFFGPYAGELESLSSSLGFELGVKEVDAAKGRARIHRARGEPKFPDELENYIQSLVDRVLSMWGLADTREIIDYVYTETEPMVGTKEGELLDFSKVQREVGAYDIKFDLKAKGAMIREQSAEYGRRAGRIARKLTKPPDQAFIDALNSLDDQ